MSVENFCCGYPTHLRGAKVEIRSLPAAEQQRWKTANRWAFYVRWQCHIDPDHHGEGGWRSTDDPAEAPPYRGGADIDPFARLRYDAGHPPLPPGLRDWPAGVSSDRETRHG
jgi:hypothetical protein